MSTTPIICEKYKFKAPVGDFDASECYFICEEESSSTSSESP